jgi:hypothetical protein
MGILKALKYKDTKFKSRNNKVMLFTQYSITSVSHQQFCNLTMTHKY